MKIPLIFALLLAASLTLLAQEENNPVAAQGMTGLINPSDTISIIVHREPDLNSAGRLAKNGTLSVPLIGAIVLAGKTTAAAESLIEAKLRDGYLVRPQVSVRITERVPRSVTVSGQVNDPGVFNIPFGQKITLVQVISMAGGATDVANVKKVSLQRGETGKIFTINLKSIISNKIKDVVLQKDDFVFVPEGWF